MRECCAIIIAHWLTFYPCIALDQETCGTETARNHQDEKLQPKRQGLALLLNTE